MSLHGNHDKKIKNSFSQPPIHFNPFTTLAVGFSNEQKNIKIYNGVFSTLHNRWYWNCLKPFRRLLRWNKQTIQKKILD